MTQRALTANKPVFGICRGHQILAVAAGGSLWQDIFERKVTGKHPSGHALVNVHSPLDKYLPMLTVNSYHHQAVRRVPAGFRIMAQSTDGIIESIWRPGALGVQFHPEMMFPNDHRWIGLFRWFVAGLR